MQRLLIHGASGRMGQALLRLSTVQTGCVVVGVVSRQIGQRVIDGVPQFAASELSGVLEFDVATDFSAAEAFDCMLAFAQIQHLHRRGQGVLGADGVLS